MFLFHCAIEANNSNNFLKQCWLALDIFRTNRKASS